LKNDLGPAVALALALTITPAAAQMLDNTAEGITAIARSFGSAQMETTSRGQPLVTGMIGDTRYGILIYGCDGGRGCESMQFFATFNTSDRNRALDYLNSWNEDQRFGTAYVNDDGSVFLHWSANMDYGVTQANMTDSFDIWRLTLTAFRDYLTPN